MNGSDSTNESDLQALERFVVDNDELLELEERIGRFNIFDALGVARVEIRHSNFLAWLLDPAESHGQGSLFLRAILMDLMRQAPPEMRPLSPVELDGEELHGVEIRREWRNIDLLITCKEPPFVIAIENKVDSSESDGQLERYKAIVEEHYRDLKPMFVFLTTDGTEPTDDDWSPYSYGDVYRVLRRVLKTSEGAIGDDVTAFLEHYLRLIGSRFMDDAKLDELCQRIYTNHRQALQLIYERAGSPAAGVLGEIEQLMETHPGEWYVINKTSKRLDFIPRSWMDRFPPIGSRPRSDPRLWMMLRFAIGSKRCNFVPLISPTKDAIVRQAVVQRLTRDHNEFGFRLFMKTAGSKWTRMGTERVAVWNEDQAPDSEKILIGVRKKLDELENRLAGIPDALQPIFDEWQASQR
jgi:hypothetical protein